MLPINIIAASIIVALAHKLGGGGSEGSDAPPHMGRGPHFEGNHNLFPQTPGLECRKSALLKPITYKVSLEGAGPRTPPPPVAKHVQCCHSNVWKGAPSDIYDPPPFKDWAGLLPHQGWQKLPLLFHLSLWSDRGNALVVKRWPCHVLRLVSQCNNSAECLSYIMVFVRTSNLSLCFSQWHPAVTHNHIPQW